MKPRHLSLTIAALLAAGGLWFAWSAWRASQFASPKSTTVSFKTVSENGDTSNENPAEDPGRREPNVSPDGQPKPRQMLRPPVPNRRFTDFTPEQRVEFARKGHGPGG